jgi:hypothetical protein
MQSVTLQTQKDNKLDVRFLTSTAIFEASLDTRLSHSNTNFSSLSTLEPYLSV